MNPSTRKLYEYRIKSLRYAAEVLDELEKEKPSTFKSVNTRQMLRATAARLELELNRLKALAKSARKGPIKATRPRVASRTITETVPRGGGPPVTRVAFPQRAQDVGDYDMEKEQEFRDHDPDIHNGSD